MNNIESDKARDRSRYLFRGISNWLFILWNILLYALGMGIAKYLGITLDWRLSGFGLVWILCITIGSYYINRYFLLEKETYTRNSEEQNKNDNQREDIRLPRQINLWVGGSILTIAASITVVIMRYIQQDPVVLTLMVLIFLGTFLQNLPPYRLAYSGYGELILAIVFSILIPGISYIFKSGEMHRLVAMSTFPLAFFYLSMALVNGLEMYSSDLRYSRNSLLIRMGWQKGIVFHNILILCGFLLLGIAALFGMPIGIVLPTFLILPLGIYQVRMIIRIGEGVKPNWSILRLNAIAIYGLVAYLLTYAYWMR